MMFGFLLLVLIVSLLVAGAVVGSLQAYRNIKRAAPLSQYAVDDRVERSVVYGGLAICCLGTLLFIGAAITGDVDFTSDVPDGCYRIGHTTGSGVVTTGGKVGVIVTSERIYTPIGCP